MPPERPPRSPQIPPDLNFSRNFNKYFIIIWQMFDHFIMNSQRSKQPNKEQNHLENIARPIQWMEWFWNLLGPAANRQPSNKTWMLKTCWTSERADKVAILYVFLHRTCPNSEDVRQFSITMLSFSMNDPRLGVIALRLAIGGLTSDCKRPYCSTSVF